MVWFFQRGSERLKIETERDAERGAYVLRLERADGTQQVEQFQTEELFRARLESLERELEAERWTPNGVAPLTGWWGLPPSGTA